MSKLSHIPVRIVQYVRAVVKQFYTIGLAIFFEFLPLAKSIPWRPIQRVMSMIEPHLIWSHRLGWSLIFLATFFAWNAERDAREAAEKPSLEELCQRINELERKQGRRVTSTQRRLFLEAAKRVAVNRIGSIHIECREKDGEATTYFQALVELFEDIGVPAGGDPYTPRSAYDPLGLALILQNPDIKPERAQAIIELLDAAKIEYKLA